MGPSGHLCTHMQMFFFLNDYRINNELLWKREKHELPLDKHTVEHLRIDVHL